MNYELSVVIFDTETISIDIEITEKWTLISIRKLIKFIEISHVSYHPVARSFKTCSNQFTGQASTQQLTLRQVTHIKEVAASH